MDESSCLQPFLALQSHTTQLTSLLATALQCGLSYEVDSSIVNLEDFEADRVWCTKWFTNNLTLDILTPRHLTLDISTLKLLTTATLQHFAIQTLCHLKDFFEIPHTGDKSSLDQCG